MSRRIATEPRNYLPVRDLVARKDASRKAWTPAAVLDTAAVLAGGDVQQEGLTDVERNWAEFLSHVELPEGMSPYIGAKSILDLAMRENHESGGLPNFTSRTDCCDDCYECEGGCDTDNLDDDGDCNCCGCQPSEDGDLLPGDLAGQARRLSKQLAKMQEGAEKSGLFAASDGEDHRRGSIPNDMDPEAVQAMHRVARVLSAIPSLRPQAKERVESPCGEETRLRLSRDVKDVKSLRPVERAIPGMMSRVVRQVAQVRERVTKVDRKQAIYMIVDCSGSMSGEAQGMALAVLINRMEAVLAGEAELWWRFYADRMFEERHVTNREEAVQTVRTFRDKGHFSEGGTDIPMAIREGAARVAEIAKQTGMRPQLVIVTDGDDCSSPIPHEVMGDAVLHAFCLGYDSRPLQVAAEASGGSYHCVPHAHASESSLRQMVQE